MNQGAERDAATPESLGEFIRTILEAPRPKARYVFTSGKLLNWTLPSMLPHAWLDEMLSMMLWVKTAPNVGRGGARFQMKSFVFWTEMSNLTTGITPSIARTLNNNCRRAQQGGRFTGAHVRIMLVREGVRSTVPAHRNFSISRHGPTALSERESLVREPQPELKTGAAQAIYGLRPSLPRKLITKRSLSAGSKTLRAMRPLPNTITAFDADVPTSATGRCVRRPICECDRALKHSSKTSSTN